MSVVEPTTLPRIELGRPAIFALLEDDRDLSLVPRGRALGEVTAISVASPERATTLQRAHALGADRVVRIFDPLLAEIDYLAMAHVLACAVRHLCASRASAPVVVLCGDRGRAAIGAAVAERLQLPHLGAVRTIELRRDELVCGRAVGSELVSYAGTAPVVLACLLDEIVTAAPDEAVSITELDLATLQVTVPELQYRRRFRPTPGTGPVARPHLVSNVERLVDRLQRDGLWPLGPRPAQPERDPQ